METAASAGDRFNAFNTLPSCPLRLEIPLQSGISTFPQRRRQVFFSATDSHSALHHVYRIYLNEYGVSDSQNPNGPGPEVDRGGHLNVNRLLMSAGVGANSKASLARKQSNRQQSTGNPKDLSARDVITKEVRRKDYDNKRI